MKVITALSRKGGSGKTTLMRALAGAAVSQQKMTLLIDADPQKALYRWQRNLGYENPYLKVVELNQPGDLEAILDEAEPTFDYAFIDTLGAGGVWADTLVELSDHLICPMMASNTDLEITKDTFNYYCELRGIADDVSLMPSFSIILTRMPSKPTKAMLLAAQEALEIFPVLDEMFLDRSQHLDVDREGLLHELIERRENDPNPLMRSHARHYRDALRESLTILEQIEAAK